MIRETGGIDILEKGQDPYDPEGTKDYYAPDMAQDRREILSVLFYRGEYGYFRGSM